MKAKKPTLKEVAAQAGVSLSAASMILSERSGVSFSEDTIRRVIQAANELNYQRPKKFSLFERPTILIFLTIVTGSYYTFIAQAVTQKADEAGYDTVILETHHSAEREKRLIHMAEHSGAQGILFAAAPINPREVQLLAKKIPTVIIQSGPHIPGMDTVTNDDTRVGQLAATHMLSLGHRHVAFMTIDRSWQKADNPSCMYAVKAAFAKVPDAVLTVYAAPGPDTLVPGSFHETRALGAKLAMEALKDEKLTGFICNTDYVAYGVMDTLSQMGKRIPEDYSVCGCNNLFSSNLTGVSLTTVDRHPIQLGRAAFELLLNKMAASSGKTIPTVTHIEYLSELLIRKTTGIPRNQISKTMPREDEKP